MGIRGMNASSIYSATYRYVVAYARDRFRRVQPVDSVDMDSLSDNPSSGDHIDRRSSLVAVSGSEKKSVGIERDDVVHDGRLSIWV